MWGNDPFLHFTCIAGMALLMECFSILLIQRYRYELSIYFQFINDELNDFNNLIFNSEDFFNAHIFLGI